MNQSHKNVVRILLVVIGFGVVGCDRSALKMPFRNRISSTLPVPVPESDPVPLNIWHDSYESAVAESEASGKPILADFTGSDWCKYCVELKKNVFETSEFKSWARENVVLLELDYPKRSSQSPELKQQNKELAQRYQINFYPTVLLLNAEGEMLGKMDFTNDPTEWIAKIESQLQHF